MEGPKSNPQITGGQPQVQLSWMSAPVVNNCPPGLEYLTQINQVLIHQQIEWFEVMTNIETKNRYILKNSLGQAIYYAKEESGFCMRYCCGSARGFELFIYDNSNAVIIKVERPLKCRCPGPCCSCCLCPRDEIRVYSPPETLIGLVRQTFEGCYRRYEILDPNENVVLRIHGPHYCKCYCPGDDFPFSIMTADGSIEVGKITKQWSGFVQEMITTADNFGVEFPLDLDVKIKAVILGAVFLIDFMFFENKNRNQTGNAYGNAAFAFS